MIKTIRDKRIDWLVSHIVRDENIMGLKPVLAGGSMLAVYRAYRLYDSETKWKQLERAACFDRAENALFKDMIDVFGDIDAWFFKESPMHNNGYGSWMLSEGGGIHHALLPDNLEAPLSPAYRVIKTSKWANSFHRGKGDFATPEITRQPPTFVFQAIKKPIDSIGDLFKTFDFVNCCVAYHDGTLYYDSKLDSAFHEFSLELNNPANYVKDCPISQRVYAGLRAFKYSKRYLLDFSADLSEHIYQTYVDIESIDYSEHRDKVTLINDVYGTALLAGDDFRDMVRSFELSFKRFTKMKTFRGDYALFLINRDKLEGIRSYINKGYGHSTETACYYNCT
jgi:hypothetical protein